MSAFSSNLRDRFPDEPHKPTSKVKCRQKMMKEKTTSQVLDDASKYCELAHISDGLVESRLKVLFIKCLSRKPMASFCVWTNR